MVLLLYLYVGTVELYTRSIYYLRSVEDSQSAWPGQNYHYSKTANSGLVVEYSIWIELKDLQGTFSLKPFVGPTPTPQSHTVRAHGRHSPSVTVVLLGDSQRPLTGQCGLAEARPSYMSSVVMLYGPL